MEQSRPNPTRKKVGADLEWSVAAAPLQFRAEQHAHDGAGCAANSGVAVCQVWNWKQV